MKAVSEFTFTGLTIKTTETYDPTKTVLGPLIQQKNNGSNPGDKFVGPAPIGFTRPAEASGGFTVAHPHVLRWDDNIDHIFMVDNIAAAATRRVAWMTYDRRTQVFTYKGYITVAFPYGGTQNTYTCRGLRVGRYRYTTGQASCAGTTSVTGNGTAWSTARIAGGARIAFGYTDPTQVPDNAWYELTPTAAPGDTSITLTTAGPDTGGNVNYVIEEYRIYMVLNNGSTAANGGLFVVKGCHLGTTNQPFWATGGGVSINAATTTDNIRVTYGIVDNATPTSNTMTQPAGVTIDDFDTGDWTTHWCYIPHGNANSLIVYKVNLRAALSLSSGRTNTAVAAVGAPVQARTSAYTTSGTISVTNNGRVGILDHGPINGTKCLFLVTSGSGTGRIYAIPVTAILNGQAIGTIYAMVDVAPGNTNAFTASLGFASVEISDTTDRLIIPGTTRVYVTRFATDSTPMDIIFLGDYRQQDQASGDSDDLVPFPGQSGGNIHAVWSEAGITYFLRGLSAGTNTAFNQLYAVPTAAHWSYTAVTNNYVITPKIATTGASKFYSVYFNEVRHLAHEDLGMAPEPFRAFYRTTGIDDNTGGWTAVPVNGDISGVSGADYIQFKLEFKVLGLTCIPARVCGLAVTYEDSTTDSHYQPSVTKSDLTNRIFAWRQATAWGGTIPTLRIRIYNVQTGVVLLDDTTALAAQGTWQYSTDGNSWSAWNSSQDAVGNYIRYTANGLTPGVTGRVVLTQ